MGHMAIALADDGVVLPFGPVEQEDIQQQGIVNLDILHSHVFEHEAVDLCAALLVGQSDGAHPEHVDLLESEAFVSEILSGGEDFIAKAFDKKAFGL